MILSASRRTDIPAFFHEWFFSRVAEGFAIARNPVNPSQARRVALSPDSIDCIVFWTKNPAPMIPLLGRLDGYNYYFQFTLTPYGRDVETRLPDKAKLIDVFRRLSDRLGVHRVVWRYDPVFVNAQHTVSYHAETFGEMARSLRGYAEKATFSFIEIYPKTARGMAGLKPEALGPETKLEIARHLASAARENFFEIDTCAESIDLSALGIGRARCVDGELASRIAGRPLDAKKDKSQRRLCGCVASVDIGAYDTCLHGCLYCYANRSHSTALENARSHDKSSPLLSGKLPETGTCAKRETKGDESAQLDLW